MDIHASEARQEKDAALMLIYVKLNLVLHARHYVPGTAYRSSALGEQRGHSEYDIMSLARKFGVAALIGSAAIGTVTMLPKAADAAPGFGRFGGGGFGRFGGGGFGRFGGGGFNRFGGYGFNRGFGYRRGFGGYGYGLAGAGIGLGLGLGLASSAYADPYYGYYDGGYGGYGGYGLAGYGGGYGGYGYGCRLRRSRYGGYPHVVRVCY